MSALTDDQRNAIRDAFKTHAGISGTGDDARIEQQVENAWAALENVLQRDLLSTAYSETYRTRGTLDELVLNQPDVTLVSQVSECVVGGLTATYSGSDEVARLEVTDTGVITTSRTGGSTTTATDTFADNATTDAMATAIAAHTGWTASVVTSRPSAYLERRPSRDAKGATLTCNVWDDYAGDYHADYEAGIIEFDGPVVGHEGRVYVSYTAGLSAVPDDIEALMVDWVKAIYDASHVSSAVASESLGDYSYSTGGGSPLQTGAMGMPVALEAHAATIEKYRRRTP